MELYPAIDVRGGRAARVPPGHPDDPLELLESWGAAWGRKSRWVHLVDMDRAYRTGDNNALMHRLLARARQLDGLRVQVGGGMTETTDIEEIIGWGASRVVVGLSLAANGDALSRLATRLGPERIAVAVEVREDRLAPRGAERGVPPGLSVEEFVGRVRQQGIRTLVYTDVARDGSLGGPDVAGARRWSGGETDVILSGGVGSLDDLKRASAAGLAGVIVGRALHEGRFTLAQALACLAV